MCSPLDRLFVAANRMQMPRRNKWLTWMFQVGSWPFLLPFSTKSGESFQSWVVLHVYMTRVMRKLEASLGDFPLVSAYDQSRKIPWNTSPQLELYSGYEENRQSVTFIHPLSYYDRLMDGWEAISQTGPTEVIPRGHIGSWWKNFQLNAHLLYCLVSL